MHVRESVKDDLPLVRHGQSALLAQTSEITLGLHFVEFVLTENNYQRIRWDGSPQDSVFLDLVLLEIALAPLHGLLGRNKERSCQLRYLANSATECAVFTTRMGCIL